MKHNVCGTHAWKWGGKDAELVSTGDTEGHRQFIKTQNVKFETQGI